ncbi:MAG TPA: lysophospholipid acyltransferase family protein [Candidatus Paceibacterota bacterium]
MTPLILQKIIWVQTRVILSFFGHFKVYGLENLKDIKSNAIFASNHSSELDPILLPASLPFWSPFSPIFYASLSKSKYVNSGWRQHFYGGTFFKLWGAHPVYTGFKDYGMSLVNQMKLLNDNKNLFVFPEGRITLDGNIQPARGGVAYLAEYSSRPIVPVAIFGVYGMRNKDFFLRKRHIKVCFGKPIYKKEFQENVTRNIEIGGNVYREEANYIMDKIREILQEKAS